MTRSTTTFVLSALALALSLTIPGRSQAQPSYSIDFQSPTSTFVNAGDVLTNVGAGQVPNPAVVIQAGSAGLGIVPTPLMISELDALSFGTDLMLTPSTQVRWEFSVDEFAMGIPTVPGPSVTTEGFFGIQEAAADIYASFTLSGPQAPPPAIGPFGVNIGIWDGNGNLTPFNAPGLNLREPNVPANTVPDNGDNVDAWEADAPAGLPTYFSLDSGFADPLETPTPPNSGSAANNGFRGGDVLVTTVIGGPPALYASAASLGLDAGGVDTDDLDALVLWENGVGGYQPTTGPFSWLGIGGSDMLLYSVRRNSAVIGTADAIFGAMIAPGDILVPVLTINGNFAPGIMVPAELLGLRTSRSFPGVIGDELDALDVRAIPEPSSLTLGLVSLAGLRFLRKRKNLS